MATILFPVLLVLLALSPAAAQRRRTVERFVAPGPPIAGGGGVRVSC